VPAGHEDTLDLGSHPSGEALSAYVDGELEPAARADVDRHVRACAHCRAQIHDFRNSSDLFRHVPTQRVPMALRRDLYKRIDEQERRQRSSPFGWLGIPTPNANVLGVAISLVLVAVMSPQLVGIWTFVTGTERRAPQNASAVESALAATSAPSFPTNTPVVLPTAEPTQVPAVPTRAQEVSGPSAGAPPVGPSPTSAPPAVPTAASAAGAPAASATRQAVPAASPSSVANAPATVVPATTTVQRTPTAVNPVLRAISGQVTNVNKPQRLLTVQTGGNAEGGAKAWTILVTEGTQVTYKDGRRLGVDDVGFADYIEVSGFEMGTGPLQAATVKVTQSAVVAARPRVLVLMDGAANLRAPQYGFTGDWIKRLGDTGYEVTAADPNTLTASTNLKDFSLIAIGYPATFSDAALQNVRASKLPVLNAEPRIVQALGLGLNVDPAQPTRMVSGKTVDVSGGNNPATRGYSGETIVGGGDLYRTPIVPNGQTLGTVTDGGQKRAVWSVSGNTMYFGFWYSANGQNHNATYWTLFDRSVLLLLGKDSGTVATVPTPRPATPAR
jgi:hypothetical protein